MSQNILQKSERRVRYDSTYVLHFCVDIWSTKQKESVLGVKTQYVDEDWNMRTDTIGFLSFPESHTGVNIKERFDSTMNDMKIKSSQVNRKDFEIIMIIC